MKFVDVLFPLVLAALQVHQSGLLPERTYDFVEQFAGERAISLGLEHFAYTGKSIDIREDPRCDFLTPGGFLLCLRVILLLQVGALCWLAPPCSTWVWISRASSKRSRDKPLGVGHKSTEDANTLATRGCYLVVFAFASGIKVIIEQPASSLLWEHPAFKKVLRFMKAKEADSDMGAFTGSSKKPLKFMWTNETINDLNRRCGPDDRKRIKTFGEKTSTCHIGEDGTVKTAGNSDVLKNTAAYPVGFGAKVGLAFHKNYFPTYSVSQPAHTKEDLLKIMSAIECDIDDGECFRDFGAWLSESAVEEP